MSALLNDDLLPSDPLAQRLSHIFLRNRWDFIYAQVPDPAQPKQKELNWQTKHLKSKPEWKTERRYPMKSRVLYHRWADPTEIIGVRFDHTTEYGLLDIDAGSQYHPKQNPNAISELQIALETIGITRTVLVRSSWSDGLHLYFPLNGAVNTFNLAVGVKFCLQTQGFEVKEGELEIFPNDKSYGVVTKILYKGHRLPLQPETGSWLLDDDFQGVSNQLSDLFQIWDSASIGQDMAELNSALLIARQNRLKKPRRRLNNVEAWRQDLEIFIAEGWSGPHQTNHLLKQIACYGVVFKELSGDALVKYIRETAIAAPGYAKWCSHQHQIELRSRSWAKAVEKYYWPLGTHAKERPADNVVPFNQRRSKTAQEEIQTALSILEEEDRLPEAITARAQAISELAGTSLGTLYRHKGLWHPRHQELEKRCVIPDATVDPEHIQPLLPPSENQLEPSDSKKLQTNREIMTCRPVPREGSFQKELKKSSKRGVRGEKKLSFPQTKSVLRLVPLIPKAKSSPQSSSMPSSVSSSGISAEQDEVIRQIQNQVRSLNWTMEEISQFIASRFDGKRRYQLSHDELLLLLYYLRTLSSE
ncbi:MAG: hypothetical protein AAGC93_19850 [Cyanobacteria bacterium P01_F01_bin.53]